MAGHRVERAEWLIEKQGFGMIGRCAGAQQLACAPKAPGRFSHSRKAEQMQHLIDIWDFLGRRAPQTANDPLF